MLIDASTAQALASIVFISTQGIENLRPQLPLQIIDRGESWLVKGTPYTDKRIDSQYVASYIFINKVSAEVIGIGSDARMIPTEAEKKEWSKTMTAADFNRVFGPRMHFQPGGSEFKMHMAMNAALYGGLINTRDDAVAYAHALMESSARLRQVAPSALNAEERADIWHIMTTVPGRTDRTEVMSFSRKTGKVLSGDL